MKDKLMYCVGLTGTIASGKSTAAAFFKSQGIPVLNADDIARQLTAKNSPALADIIEHFGEKIVTTEGELDRRQLRQWILAHPMDKQWLEDLLHPLIRQHIELSITELTGPYCVVEIPLLSDRKSYPYLNRVLLITAEPQQQIARLVKRDHCSESEAMAWLSHQEHNNNRAELADDIMVNTGSLDELHSKLNALHQRYLAIR